MSITLPEAGAAPRLYAPSAPSRLSLLRYAPAFVLLLVVVADSAQFPDPDLWGHLSFGRAALLSGHVVVRDTYSYTASGRLWRNHEWLSEIVMATAYNSLGVFGLKLWKFACVAGTIVLMSLGLAETGASPAIQLNTLGFVAIAMIPQNQFRPQLFTFMLLAALLALLARENYRGSAHLWLVVPIMMLWGNLHGGFLVGIATLTIYTFVAGSLDLIAGRGLRRTLRLSLITLAGTLVTLVSPYGIGAWLVVLNALKHYTAQPIIADWQPLLSVIWTQWQLQHLSVIFLVCGIAIMIAFAVAFISAPSGDDLTLAVVAAMMSVAAFTAVRNMPLAMVACAAPLSRHLELIARPRRRNCQFRKWPSDIAVAPAIKIERPAINQWPVACIAMVLALVAGLFSAHIAVDAEEYPVGAVAFMRRHNLHGNILNDLSDGEYLIWHLPASRVFIDGRYDTVYSQTIIDQYLDFIDARPGAPGVLRAYPHDFVLIPRGARAFAMMRKAIQWKLVYLDAHSALFEHADSAVAKMPGIPIEGDTPESRFP